ncbi:MAG: DUF4244 domain-containing protein [Actinomycetota bacterium]
MRRVKDAFQWLGRRYDLVRADLGQTTAEYALVLLGAAAVALVLISWASGDDNGIKEFFEKIMEKLIASVSGP